MSGDKGVRISGLQVRSRNSDYFGKEWSCAPEFTFRLSCSLSFWQNNYVFFLCFIYKWNICKLWHRFINSLTFELLLLTADGQKWLLIWMVSCTAMHMNTVADGALAQVAAEMLQWQAASVSCCCSQHSADSLSPETRGWASTDGNEYFLTLEAIQVMAKGCQKGTIRKWTMLLLVCPYFPNKCRISPGLSVQHPSEETCFFYENFKKIQSSGEFSFIVLNWLSFV